MIRVVPLEAYDSQELQRLCRSLYTAFGVGCESAAHVALPAGVGDPIDARKLLDQVQLVRAYADDKLLYLSSKKLKDRELPSGTAPTLGYALYGKDRALVSTHGVKNWEEGLKRVARHSLHQLGHPWELHHCLDPRCSMYPPWTPSCASGDSIFCTFCR